MNCFHKIILRGVTLVAIAAQGQLAVTVSPVKTAGQKAVVPLAMRNDFSEKIQSARAVVFLTDEQGKTISNETRWIIGGSQDKPGLEAGATNTFHFVISSDKPFATTNLTATVNFSRIVLQSGKHANPVKDVQIQNSEKTVER